MANLLTGNSATFASGLADWNKSSPAQANFTLSHSAADGGVLSAAVTVGGQNISVVSHLASDPVKMPVTAGTVLTVGATSKQLNGTPRTWMVQLQFYDSAGTNTDNPIVATRTLTVGSYVTLSGAITVPAGVVRCRMRTRWDAPAVGETFYLDNPSVDDAGGGGGVPINVGDTASLVRTGSGWVLLREDGIS